MTDTLNTQPTPDPEPYQTMIVAGILDDDRTVSFGDYVDVLAWRGTDGALVIQLDPADHVERLRVVIGDDVAYDSNAIAGVDYLNEVAQ